MNNKTSKDTRASSGPNACSDTNCTNSLELRRKDGEFPTSGLSILTRYLESAYVGDMRKDTIGCKGIAGL